MPRIDSESGRLVVQIVYDGAPFSGKTESIKALGRLLNREVLTPEEDNGRTTYFDWLDYEAGSCLGRPIECRVLTVPGQEDLALRRAKILQAADAVIFVADSTPDKFEQSIEHLEKLRLQLDSLNRKMPVFLQLNKRDEGEVLKPSKMLEGFGSFSFRRCVETVATEGVGVREMFIFAVSEVVGELRKSKRLYSVSDTGYPGSDQLQLHRPSQLLEVLENRDTNPIEHRVLKEILKSP